MLPAWKKIFSWLWPIPEGRSASPINPELEWRWENGQLVLNSKLANYSYGSLHKVMRAAIRRIPPGKKHRILLLGVGGGSALRLLENVQDRVACTDAVDADPEVLRLARSVFGIQESAVLKLHVADALAFVQEARSGNYDIVIEDVFIDLTKPDFCREAAYFAQLQRILAPYGKLLLNSLPKDETEAAAWKKLMENHFSQVNVQQIAGNNLLWEGRR